MPELRSDTPIIRLLVLRQLRASPARFVLTVVGVALAVTFVVAALVIGDGHRGSLGSTADDITGDIDLELRPTWDFGPIVPLSEDVVSAVAAVDGIAAVEGRTEAPWNEVGVSDGSGQAIDTDGQPRLAMSWPSDGALNPFLLVDGSAPEAGQFVVDVDSAREHGLVVTETYTVTTPSGSSTLMLSGLSTLGADNNTLGALALHFNEHEVRTLFEVDGYTTVVAAIEDGANRELVLAEVAEAAPTAAVADRETALADARARFRSGFTAEGELLEVVLIGFGVVSLLVSSLMVANTFATSLGQRTAELALLRTVGAGPGQIRRAILGEALLIGGVATTIGIPGGLAVSRGLEALFNATGDDMPPFPLIIGGRTVAAALLVGVGVTLLTTARPAWRASRVPPLVAVRATGDGATTSGPIRRLSSAALGLAGAPAARLAGVAGGLARQNAARNPRRSAVAASALMLGLMVVSAVLVVGQSVKATFAEDVDRAIVGDYILSGEDGATLPLAAAGEIADDPAVDAALGFRFVTARVNGEVASTAATDLGNINKVYDPVLLQGGYGEGVLHPTLILDDHAARTGLGPGDVVPVELADGTAGRAAITGVYTGSAIFGTDFLVDESLFDQLGDATGPSWIAVAVSEAAGPTAPAASIDGWQESAPSARIETTTEIRDRLQGLVDEGLLVVNFLMALTVIIALIGITNTMILATVERTRELGLLRAVGMSRRQVRRMIRHEASIVAGVGSALGIGLGLGLGAAAALSLPDHYAATVAIPVRALMVVMAVALVAGIASAVIPARRAATVDVLRAVAR